jgi:HD-GYP domain-containing protein (c-di-GMP phosphodiesterase class II)
MSRTSLFHRIEKLVEIGVALSAEKDTEHLMEMILLGAKAITNADAGTLYTVTDDDYVKIEIMRTDSLDFALGGTTGTAVPFPPIALQDQQGNPNGGMVVTHAVLNDITVNIPDAYTAVGFDFSGTRTFDQKTGYRSRSFLTVPMKNHDGDIIGVLQLINALDDETGEVIPFSPDAQRLTESLASQAAVVLTNRRLICDLQELFKSFIHLIATAIDEKSPYTGGHCKRVPVITMMIADAVARTRTGPFRDFSMDDDDRYELEVAAWLHDCGKITTPEYVMDKATKLETKFDRIHLIDTRCEILARDAEIASLKRQLAAPDDLRVKAEAEKKLHETLELLKRERSFVRDCNSGGEVMEDGDQERVQALTLRHYITLDGNQEPLLSADESSNLCISRGTLTPAERQTINNHIVATISMLDALPFPKQLKNVPEYAGGHHERVDGTGYPRGLTRDQMSVQARIVAIADVFEALTAGDRPYKSGKKLSESIAILQRMASSGHIDPDLFDVFMREKIYLRYAEQFLDSDQIDVESLTY